MKNKDKSVLATGDWHCGHVAGLTPPDWQYPADSIDETTAKFARVQSETWNWFVQEVDKLRPIDILIVNGDLIEGKGTRSGGTECIRLDRHEQCDMAAYIINWIDAHKVQMTHGTPYHAGQDEDFEKVILGKIKAPYKFLEGHAFPVINGVQFDIKHKIGGSSIPHGRFTAIARDKLWNTIWSSRAEAQPKANVLIRSHVHYHVVDMNPAEEWIAMTLPAMQAFGSKYGIRQCSGTVEIGFVHFNIQKNGDFTWKSKLAELSHMKVQPRPL